MLRVLSKLYKDYILALNKQRSSLFPSTLAGQQARERIRLAALRFGDECLVCLKKMGREDMQESIWQTTLDVLQVTEKEALFDLSEKDHIATLEELGEDALRHLDHAWNGEFILTTTQALVKCFIFCRQGLQSPLAIHALDVHSCLQRIHPELGVQFLPRILERIATVRPFIPLPPVVK